MAPAAGRTYRSAMRNHELRVGLALGLLGLTLPVTSAVKAGWYAFHAFRRGPPPARPADLALEEVRLPQPEGEMRGWYLPAHNRAAVVLVHGSEADRSNLLPEARLLASAGYGALLLDLPGVGESAGRQDWGAPAVAAVRAGAGWLTTRPEVDPGRIGALGFSLGSAVTALAAAEEPRLRAVALEGAFPDYQTQIQDEFCRWGLLTGEAAVLGAEAAGVEVQQLRPVDALPRLAGRPLLFVAGYADHTVRPDLTLALYQAAPQPKQIWLAPHAAHGGYAQADPQAYRQTLLGFFDEALAPPRP